EVLLVDVALVLEHDVVELPESVAAGEGEDGLRRLGRRSGLLVEGQRLVFPDDTDLVGAVGLLDLLERAADAAAEWALKVAELHDGDQRVRVAPARVFGRNGDR